MASEIKTPLIKFCMAVRELDSIDASNAKHRKDCRLKIKALKHELVVDMQQNNITCIPVSEDGRTIYVRTIHKKRAPGVLSVDRLVSIIRDVLQDASPLSPLMTLDAPDLATAVSKHVRAVLTPVSGTPSIQISPHIPRNEKVSNNARLPHCSVHALINETSHLTSMNKKNKLSKQNYQNIRNEMHDVVADQLSKGSKHVQFSGDGSSYICLLYTSPSPRDS